MKEKIIFVGGGEHCAVVLAVLKKRIRSLKLPLVIYGIIDKKENIGKELSGIKIIGIDSDLPGLKKEVKYAFVSIGGIGDNSKRHRSFTGIKKIGYKPYTIVSVDSVVDGSVTLGEGAVVMPGVIINCNTKIGNNVIINTGAVIDHDCIIEDGVHIAPGVNLSGGVHIGELSHIGTGTTVIQHIDIGRNTLIGAGSVVVKSIGDNVVAYGTPCRVKRNE